MAVFLMKLLLDEMVFPIKEDQEFPVLKSDTTRHKAWFLAYHILLKLARKGPGYRDNGCK